MSLTLLNTNHAQKTSTTRNMIDLPWIFMKLASQSKIIIIILLQKKNVNIVNTLENKLINLKRNRKREIFTSRWLAGGLLGFLSHNLPLLGARETSRRMEEGQEGSGGSGEEEWTEEGWRKVKQRQKNGGNSGICMGWKMGQVQMCLACAFALNIGKSDHVLVAGQACARSPTRNNDQCSHKRAS